MIEGLILLTELALLLLAKIGVNVAPNAMTRSALTTSRCRQRNEFDFDLVDGHHYDPDGVAAGFLARWLGRSKVSIARGTDLNLISQCAQPRRLMLETAANARASICGCLAQTDSLRDLGAEPSKLRAFRNGVDLERFAPELGIAIRARLGLPSQGLNLLFLSVGPLIKRKGQNIAILTLLSKVRFLVVGGGSEQGASRNMALDLGATDRVAWSGAVTQTALEWWHSAADALTSCSSHEGWASALPDPMACGTQVLASNTWGRPEVVCMPTAGVLTTERGGQGLAQEGEEINRMHPFREATRAHAESASWESTTQGQWRPFDAAFAKGRG